MENWYLGHKDGLSNCNEPIKWWSKIEITPEELRQYPDTKNAYESFHKLTGLDYSNFILTNGCEDAAKCALLALKIKELTIPVPGWSKVEKLCEALDILTFKRDFIIHFFPSLNVEQCVGPTTCASYKYYPFSNYFAVPYIEETDGISIYDFTYTDISWKTNIDLVNTLIKNPKNVIIGSYSKTVGAGCRLGYCIYNSELSDAFHLQKPHNINVLGCKVLDMLANNDRFQNEYAEHYVKTNMYVEECVKALEGRYFKILAKSNNFISFIDPCGRALRQVIESLNLKVINTKSTEGNINVYVCGIPRDDEELKMFVDYFNPEVNPLWVPPEDEEF